MKQFLSGPTESEEHRKRKQLVLHLIDSANPTIQDLFEQLEAAAILAEPERYAACLMSLERQRRMEEFSREMKQEHKKELFWDRLLVFLALVGISAVVINAAIVLVRVFANG